MLDGHSVLVIEDDRDTREMYAELLKFSGFDVVTARNGMEGFTRAAESKPTVILTDLGLPSIDGWEVIRRLRSDDRTSAIPIVVVTGRTTPELNSMASQLGTRLLTKPCEPDVLVQQVTEAASINR
jgi:DNA-binding response OmpR family regulator